jgi:hypothetical protein
MMSILLFVVDIVLLMYLVKTGRYLFDNVDGISGSILSISGLPL